MKLRFSLASLLLLALTIGAGMLLSDKWPALTLVKTQPVDEFKPKPEEGRFSWEIETAPNAYQHHFDRFAGIEVGDPGEAIPCIPFTKEMSQTMEFQRQTETHLLFWNSTTQTFSVYEMGKPDPVAVIPDPFHTPQGKYTEFCWPRKSGIIHIDGQINSNGTHRYYFIEFATGKLVCTLEASPPRVIRHIIRAQGHWYGMQTQLESPYVVDLELGRELSIPPPPEAKVGNSYFAWPFEEDSTRLRITLENNGEPVCSTLWDLSTGKALDWKPGVYVETNIPGTYVRGWITPEGSAYELIDAQGSRLLPPLKGQRAPLLNYFLSRDGQRLMGSIEENYDSNKEGKARTWIWELNRDIPPSQLPRETAGFGFSSDSQFILSYEHRSKLLCWRINHPDCWYGVIYLYVFWLTLILSILLLLSIRKDFRTLKT